MIKIVFFVLLFTNALTTLKILPKEEKPPSDELQSSSINQSTSIAETTSIKNNFPIENNISNETNNTSLPLKIQICEKITSNTITEVDIKELIISKFIGRSQSVFITDEQRIYVLSYSSRNLQSSVKLNTSYILAYNYRHHYVAGVNSLNIIIADLSYDDDIRIRYIANNDTDFPSKINEIVTCNNSLYLACGEEGLIIYDFKNTSDIKKLIVAEEILKVSEGINVTHLYVDERYGIIIIYDSNHKKFFHLRYVNLSNIELVITNINLC